MCGEQAEAAANAPKVLLDHPRVCGEQDFVDDSKGKTYGSPPRVRGTACMPLKIIPTWRITPACAGNRGRDPRE